MLNDDRNNKQQLPLSNGLNYKKRKGANKMLRHLLKIISKVIISMITKILTLFLPLILVCSIFFSIAFFINYEFKGQEQEYDYREPNTYDKVTDEEKGRSDYVATDINQENEVMRDFYKYFSGISYWQINVKHEQGKLIGPYDKDAVQDYYGREKQFQLHPNFLYMLDEYFYDNKWQYPEQMIKPVAYEYNPTGVSKTEDDYEDVSKDKEAMPGEKHKLKLKPLLNKSGDIIVESHKRDLENFKELEDMEKSVSDYGLATVFKYKEMQRSKVASGVYIAKDVYNPITKQVEKQKIEEPYEFDLPLEDTTPKYIIEELVCLTGHISFQYEEGRVKTEGVNEGESSNETDNVQKIKYDEVVEEVLDTAESNRTGRPVIKRKTIPLYKYRDTNISGIYNVGDVPTKPDIEDYGFKYYVDYLDKFKAYIPGKVLIDVNRRIDYNELRKIEDAEKNNNAEQNMGAPNIDLAGSNVGGKTDSTSFKNAMQYFDLAQKYGNQYGFDPYLIVAMMAQESGGNPNASGGGILQIQDKTTSFTRDDGTKETYTANPYNVESSIKYIAMRMGNNLKKYKGDYMMTMFSYNMGEGTANYILSHHPEEYKNGTWMNFREEARAHMAAKSGYPGRRSASNYCIPKGMAQGSGGLWGDTCYIENVLRYYGGNGSVKGQGQEGAMLTSQTGQAQTQQGLISGIKSKTVAAAHWLSGKLIQGFETFQAKLKDYWNKFLNKYEDPYPCMEFTKSLNVTTSEDIRKMAQTYSTMELFSEVSVENSENPQTMMEDGFLANYNGLDASLLGIDMGESEWGEFCGYGGYVPPLSGPIRVTSKFGWRIHPKLKTKKKHEGIDLGAPSGTPVMASSSGTVTRASSLGGYGNVIFIKHPDGLETRYAHLSQILVSVGSQVQTGQIIGKVGSTGLSTGPHLHFELRVNGQATDPSAIVRGEKKGPAPQGGSFGCAQGKMATGTMASPDGGNMPKAAGQIVATAQRKIGSPYKWGHRGPNSFDCSGFVQWVYKELGINVPGTTSEWRTSGLMSPRNRSNLQVGDVFLMNTTRRLGHVGIYIGNGKMIHASSLYGQVRIDDIDNGYFESRVDYNYVYSPKLSK